ncbi:MAG: hypothetical protein Q3W93_09980, partial [Eubacterium sp.]|nr:hypothetical protein [Eubacterium sp.]
CKPQYVRTALFSFTTLSLTLGVHFKSSAFSIKTKKPYMIARQSIAGSYTAFIFTEILLLTIMMLFASL